jgi:hypothetical protein
VEELSGWTLGPLGLASVSLNRTGKRKINQVFFGFCFFPVLEFELRDYTLSPIL